MKKCLKMAPCAAYDIVGMQTWLEAMAQKGFLLEKDGFWGAFAVFSVGAPCCVKYRLEAAPKGTGMLTENGGEPDEEQVAISEEFHWAYVAKRGDFFIFRSETTDAREFNTDPTVQALALNAVKRRQLSAVVVIAFYFAYWGWKMWTAGLLSALLHLGTVSAMLIAVLMGLWLADCSVALHTTRLAQQHLRTEGTLPPPSKRRATTVRYFFGKGLGLLLVIVLMVTAWHGFENRVTDGNRIPLSEVSDPLPFATMRDFAGGGSSDYTPRMSGMGNGFNSVAFSDDLLAVRVIDYSEQAHLTCADGSTMDGSLYVDYAELRSAELANALAKEWLCTAKRDADYEEIAFSGDADFVAAYYNEMHYPELIVQKGAVAARIAFYRFYENDESPDDWMPIAVALLK